MASGRRNKLAGQIAEQLVCAELGRRDLIATSFSGNVPAFDVLATNEYCHTVPIQVKASRSDSWQSNVGLWMNIEFDEETNEQKYVGPLKLATPDLIYVYVTLRALDSLKSDRFFILTMSDLQQIAIEKYTSWMDKHAWRRPKNPEALHLQLKIADFAPFENNWDLIETRLSVDGLTGAR